MIRKTIYLAVLLSGIFFVTSCTGDKKQEPKKEEKKEVKKESTENRDQKEYLEKGIKIAKMTGKALKSKLKAAVDEGGIENGINTCNKVAQNMMDSLSNVYGVKVKRTTMKLRNEKDKPDQYELEMLDMYSKLMKDSQKPKPVFKEYANGEKRVYAPIMVDKVCLNCHGKIGDNVKPENYAVIKKHYPNDEAINFKEGDLRGMWSVTFNK
ncbi:MAG TPA: DUF3365 domain-containing protein [Bacteroidetes bacterium]|nr:DUF3365 domain-containing protein [Bacteroidota bacterium]